MYQKINQLIISDLKVSDMILDNPYFLLMLEHFNIGLVVHEKTVGQICEENSINTNLFLTFANLFNGFDAVASAQPSFTDVPTIVRYLQTSHRYYLDEKLPEILSYFRRMSELNDSSEIRLAEIFFSEYWHEIIEHLNYENDVVFPYFLEVFSFVTGDQQVDFTPTYSVQEYRNHHNDIEEKLADLRSLLTKYLPLKEDQQIRRKLLVTLFELEYDLNIHSRIEDEILVPLVELMEHKLGGGK